MIARSFFIESSSKLLVLRMSLISGRIRLLTLELHALEWRTFYTFELEFLWGQLTSLHQILCVASLEVGKEADWIKTLVSMATECPYWLKMGKMVCPPFLGCFWSDLFSYLQVTRTCILSRTSSNFGQIGPLNTELAALERLEIPHRLIIGKWCLHASSFILI